MTAPFYSFDNKFYFLCEEQNFDLPDALFLHFFPALVFAGHLAAFFAFFAAMLPPYDVRS